MNFLDGRLPERFWSKCTPEPNSGCWLWFAAEIKGYGVLGLQGTRHNVLAHRLAFIALVGPVPEGLELDHLCRVPACVNPEHLEPVTHAENMRRSPLMRAGAGGAVVFRNKTHCPKGHTYDAENTIYKRHTRGHIQRLCGRCERARWSRSNAKRRASR